MQLKIKVVRVQSPRLKIISYLLILLVLDFSFAMKAHGTEVPAVTRPFQRVLVLSGNGLNAALSMGVIKGLQNKGWSPDLIIATCGSAIPVAILKAKGNLDAAKNFLYGDDYRALVQSVTIQRGLSPFIAKTIYWDSPEAVATIFGTPILKVAMQWPATAADQDLTKKFDDIKNESPAVAIISGHAYFGPVNTGAIIKGRKLIRETFFTDSKTGYLISQSIQSSPVADTFPNSYVDSPIEIRTDLQLFQAARGSVADPYLIAPYPNPTAPADSGDYYMTGAVDLFPIDIAEKLGDEVVALYGASFGGIEVRANLNAFGYNTQDRLKNMTQEKIRAWVDLSDDDRWDGKIGFDPRAGLIQVKNAIPKDTAKFEALNDAQWSLGVQRAEEALNLPAGDVAHIRSPAR